jgi:hypothetical protein
MPELEDVSLGGPDTHIPALDGDPSAEPTGEESIPALEDTPDADQPQDAPEGDEGAVVDGATGDDALLQQFAKRTGLDPNDPGQKKTLDTLVAKEKYIQELQGKLKASDVAAQADQPQPLTKFEQEQIQAAEAAAAAQQGKQGQAPQMPNVGQYNDVGAQWQSPSDAYQDLSRAWSHAQETGDFRPVVATEAALYERRFDAIGMPKVQALVAAQMNQFFEQHFGTMMPMLQEQAAMAQSAAAEEFAFHELEGTDSYKDIRALNQEQEGPPLTVNGEQYRNTPLNRILAENPWIMHIKRDAPDPQVADRLTYLARLKAAHSIHSKGRISAQAAKALVDAGSQQEQRRAQDAVRQSLNKGGTPSKGLDKGGAKPKSYMEELMGVGSDGPMSFSDL